MHRFNLFGINDENIQKKFLINFLIAIVMFILGYTVFSSDGYLKNLVLQISSYFVSIYIVFNVFFNWAVLNSYTRIKILSTLFLFIIIYSNKISVF